MKIVEAMSLKQMFSKLSSERANLCLSLMPQGLRDFMQKLPDMPVKNQRDFTKDELLAFIHPSWFEEGFEQLKETDLCFLKSLIPSKNEKSLNLYRFSSSLQNHLTDFFFEDFLQALEIDASSSSFFTKKPPQKKAYFPPPISMISDDPLLALLEKKDFSIETLILYLGLYDLTTELKKILFKKILLSIEQMLSDQEIAFIQHIRKTEKFISIGDMGLAYYKGDEEALRKIIQERGMIRLAKALANTSSGLIWYVMHKMEKQTAIKMHPFLTPIENLNVENKLKKQVMNTWEWLCTASHS